MSRDIRSIYQPQPPLNKIVWNPTTKAASENYTLVLRQYNLQHFLAALENYKLVLRQDNLQLFLAALENYILVLRQDNL